MKAWILILAVVLTAGNALAQDITGDWFGVLDVQGEKLRVVAHIKASGDSLAGSFDSPDQDAFDLPFRNVSFDGRFLRLTADFPPLQYTGELTEGVFKGIYNQSGYDFPLDLSRVEPPKALYIRPQEPQEPFPYLVEDVEFVNPTAGIKLAGTLTLPRTKSPVPAVVLISGSGAQNRDEEIMGHKPFWVIADHLTRAGIAVLRYDDRGYAASEGEFRGATSEDFATDARAAMQYLQGRPEIGGIGLMGHSEGGMIAPMLAAQYPDVKFIVLLAGPGIRGDKLLLSQEEAIWRAENTEEQEIQRQLYLSRNIYEIILSGGEPDSLQLRLRDFIARSIADGHATIPEGYTEEDVITQYTAGITSPWMLWFLRHDPAPILERVHCPVLAVNGSLDLQVPAQENLAAIGAALDKAGNKDVTLMEFPGLNHLFQTCETGHPDEYVKIEQTFAPEVLGCINDWIKERVPAADK